MAAQVNLDPEHGRVLSSTIVALSDGTIIEAVQESYNACVALGDNNMTDSYKEKFARIEAYYNDTFVPAVNAAKRSLEEYTDFAEYVKNLQMDSTITEGDIGTHQGNNYDAARSL